MDTKYFLKSKTIIGALLIFLATMAPMLGIDFSPADAASLTGKFGVAFDGMIELVGLALVVWGRVTASTGLHLGSNKDTLNSPWWVAGLVLLVLTACSTASLDGKTPLEKLRISYDSTVPLINVYTALPTCGPEVLGLCSKPDIVVKLTDAVSAAQTYLDRAEAAQTLSDFEKAAAMRDAQNALRTLITLYAVQALTRA